MTNEEHKIINELKKMGVQVFYKDQKGKFASMTWDQLGGYEQQKRDIEDTILMALKYPGKATLTGRNLPKRDSQNEDHRGKHFAKGDFI